MTHTIPSRSFKARTDCLVNQYDQVLIILSFCISVCLLVLAAFQ